MNRNHKHKLGCIFLDPKSTAVFVMSGLTRIFLSQGKELCDDIHNVFEFLNLVVKLKFVFS